MSSLIKELKGLIGDAEERSENIDFEAGLMRFNQCREDLLHQFDHGKRRGETTHIREIDKHFTWKKGYMGVFTGYPNSGKSEKLITMSLLKAVKDDWKVSGFFPENMSSTKGRIMPDEIADTMMHTIMGRTTDPFYGSQQMPRKVYEYLMDDLSKKITIVYPKGKPTPKLVLDHYKYIQEKEEQDIFILDPFNKLHHEPSGLIDTYLLNIFSDYKRFNVESDSVMCFVEHPKAYSFQGGKKGGEIPPATQHDLRGGAAWNNAMDFIVSMHRPNPSDISDTRAQFISWKLRNQKLIGIPGSAESNFSRKENRYEYGTSRNPFEEIAKEIYKKAGVEYLPPLSSVKAPDAISQISMDDVIATTFPEEEDEDNPF